MAGESPTLKKAGDCWGHGFSRRESTRGASHRQTVATTTAVVDPTVWPWQPAFTVLAISCGQQTPRAVRGESHSPWRPCFQLSLWKCAQFLCLFILYSPINLDKGAFWDFFRLLYIEVKAHNHEWWENLIEWLQHPIRLYFEKSKQLTCSKPVSYP